MTFVLLTEKRTTPLTSRRCWIPGYSEADFFAMMHDLDTAFELELKVEEMDPADPEDFRTKVAAKKEEKKKAPKVNVDEAAQSWTDFAHVNKPQAYV